MSISNTRIPNLTFVRCSLMLHSQLLRHGTTVHLNQFRTVPMSSIKSCVQRSHRVALAGSKNRIDSCTMIQKNFARVQMTMQSRDMKRCLAIVSSDVQRARSFFRQPFYQLDSTGRNGLVSYSRATHGFSVKRSAVLS